MSFPDKILCPHCKDWHIADKGACPVPQCDWGDIDYEVDLSQPVPDRLVKAVT